MAKTASQPIAQPPEADDSNNVDDSPTEHGPLTKTHRRTLVFTLCMTVFLSALDITIIATALPTIARHLDANAAEYVWIGSSYTLASTSLTPVWGKASEIWGGKPMLILAAAVFLGGSLIAALSVNVAMLIGGRVVQGLGGGGINILVSILIGHLFPLRDRAKYYGMTAIVWAVASGLGPVLGGVFTQTAGWRWCFYINLPIGALALALLTFLLKVPSPRKPVVQTLRDIDWLGCALIVCGTIMFLYGLESGSSRIYSWSSPFVLGLLVAGSAALVLFALYEWHVAIDPVVPVKIFANKAAMASLGVSSSHALVFIAYDYFLPLYFQSVLKLRPISSGLLLFALVIPLSIMSTATGFFIKKTGSFRSAIWFGLTAMTIGTGLFMAFDDYLVWAKVIVFQIVAGVGAGPLFQSPLIALQTHLSPDDMAPGTSGMTFLRSLCTSISIVIGGVILQQGLGSETFLTHNTTDDGDSEFDNATYMSALRNMWIFYTVICGIGLLISLFVPGKVAESKILVRDAGSVTEFDHEQRQTEASVSQKQG